MDADEIPNNELGQNPCKCNAHIMLYFLHLVSIVYSPSAGLSGLAKELLSDFADSLPGIDEAKSFMQVMGLVISTVQHTNTQTCKICSHPSYLINLHITCTCVCHMAIRDVCFISLALG